MKFLLLLLPVVLSSPVSNLIHNLHLDGIFDLDTLKCDVQVMLDVLGGDPTEQACEAECHKVLTSGAIMQHSCPLVCHGFQSLVHQWHITPDATAANPSKCTGAGATAVGRRNSILDKFHFKNPFELSQLKCDVQLMIDALGSDPSEAACETECHQLLTQGHIFNYACPLVCHGFQSLVHQWHIVPDTTSGTPALCTAAGSSARKRMLLDTITSAFHMDNLKCDVQLMIDALGGDPTEQACETECHSLITTGHIFDYSCPLVCHGFQNLVHKLHIAPQAGNATCSPASTRKRFFLDTIGSVFQLDNLKCDVQLMLDALGSDPTEAACENECHQLLSQGHVFNYGCGLVCHGFQNLVHVWHITPGKSDCAGVPMAATTTMATDA